MSSEHKRPLYAFAIVALACAFFVGTGLRSEAFTTLFGTSQAPQQIAAGVVHIAGIPADGLHSQASGNEDSAQAPRPLSVDSPADASRVDVQRPVVVSASTTPAAGSDKSAPSGTGKKEKPAQAGPGASDGDRTTPPASSRGLTRPGLFSAMDKQGERSSFRDHERNSLSSAPRLSEDAKRGERRGHRSHHRSHHRDHRLTHQGQRDDSRGHRGKSHRGHAENDHKHAGKGDQKDKKRGRR